MGKACTPHIVVTLITGVHWWAPFQPLMYFFFSAFLKQTSVIDPEGSVLTVAQLIIGVMSGLSLPFCQHLKQLCLCAAEWGCLDSSAASRGENTV